MPKSTSVSGSAIDRGSTFSSGNSESSSPPPVGELSVDWVAKSQPSEAEEITSSTPEDSQADDLAETEERVEFPAQSQPSEVEEITSSTPEDSQADRVNSVEERVAFSSEEIPEIEASETEQAVEYPAVRTEEIDISEPLQDAGITPVEPPEIAPDKPLELQEDLWETTETRDREETIVVSFSTPEAEVSPVEIDRQPPENNDSEVDRLEIDRETPESDDAKVDRLEIDRKPPESDDSEVDRLHEEITQLKRQKQSLQKEIQALQTEKASLISQQMAQLQAALSRLTQENLQDLEERKKSLQGSVEQLERRRDRIREEMRTSFAGVSQDMAIRVQGFKDYLVGSLQDLTAAAEQLELPKFEARPEPREEARMRRESRRPPEEAPAPRFAKQGFQEQRQQINALLERYRARPDYYGPPWQLRRTFEPIHAERVQKWFISQGGRGAIRTMGSRLQNILIASAAMSVLRNLYGDRLRVLVLSNTPERLGEWRRGLQDCLGISRSDFGPTRGVVLFESPEALVQKAERFTEEKLLPLVVIDEAEGQLDLSLLQFPLLLAFAPDPNSMSSYSF
ncbi:DUF3086 domain-containing protein [Oscillatoria sp. FACHB-1406]|nr:DUF3086 domain-containing protein [Oscillatoria sp. FACHB-1406]